MDELIRQIHAWRRDLERDPSQRLYHRIAESLLKVGRPAAALDIAEKGLFIHDKKYLTCIEAKGLALLALGRYAAAVETLKPIAAQLGSVETKRKLAAAMFGATMDDEAAALCRDLLRLNPFDRETKQLLSKGRQALPEPITSEPPLPEDEEPPPPAEEEPELPPAEWERPRREPLRELRHEESPPLAAEKPVEQPDSPPQSAKSTAPAEKAASAPAKTREVPADPQTPIIASAGIEGLVAHLATEGQKPLEADAVNEADELVEDFFRRMETNGNGSKPAVTFVPSPPEPASHSMEPEVTPEEHSVEYDPTEGFDDAVDLEEVDVFGELGTETRPAHVNAVPSSAEPLPAQESATEKVAAESTELVYEPVPEDGDAVTEAEAEAAEKKERGLRGWFRRWRSKKEA